MEVVPVLPDRRQINATGLPAVQTSRPIALALAALFAGLLPIYLVLLTGSARTLMASLAAASAVGLLGWAEFARRWPERATPRVCDALAVVPLVNSVAQLAVSGDARQTTTLPILFVAVGAGVRSRRTAVAMCGAGTGAWVILSSSLPASAHRDIVRTAIQLGSSLLIAGVLFETRRRREDHLLSVSTQLVEHVGQVEAAQQEVALSEHRFRTLFADSPVGIVLSDEHGLFVATNHALCLLLGREEEQLLGHSGVEFTHPDDLPFDELRQEWLERANGKITRIEKRYMRPSGEVRWVGLTINKVDGPNGQPWSIAHMQDITERRGTEQALADSEANLSAVAAVVRRIRTGEDARQAITTAALELAGADSACIIEPLTSDSLVVTAAAGRALAGTVIPLDSMSTTATVFRGGQPLFLPDALGDPRVSPALLHVTEATSVLWQPVIADGVVTGVLTVTWPHRIESVNHRVVRAIELLADETAVALQHDQLLSRLAELASTDTLTGVGNRRAWDDRLGRLMAQARRTGAPLTVAFVDLDRFKAFNDRYGHLRGDALLSTTARRFQGQLREVDLLARWGGEEFAVALPGCDSEAAEPMLERLRGEVSHGQTCSVGYATWDSFETPEQLLARADAALYDAKSAGRDRSVAALLPFPRQPPVEKRTGADQGW